MRKIVIAIDGYSSCGKSTMAKDLAREIGYIYVDTGAMYRSVTLFAMRNGLFNADTEKENYKILSSYVKSLGDYVPPLIHSYIELSSSMKTFGTVFDPSFGDVYDTAMIITLADVYEKKWKRYVESYKKESR